MRVLLTTTSYQDTPGAHHALLESQGYEIVRARGPLPAAEMMELVGDIDGIICGDDEYTAEVLQKALPRLKALCKYGIGLDQMDLVAATRLKIPVCFTPGVNHTTAAEHTIGLMIALARHIPRQDALVRAGQWTRITGVELFGKTLGIAGLGRIGKEVAKRALAFEMRVTAYDVAWDEEFLAQYPVKRADTPDQMLRAADFVALHMNLTDATRDFLNKDRIASLKPGVRIINCARAGLVSTPDLVEALRSGHVAGYATDLTDQEPAAPDDPLLTLDNTIITPHVGSRTYESVVRQATMATRNLINVLSGKPPLAQANPF